MFLEGRIEKEKVEWFHETNNKDAETIASMVMVLDKKASWYQIALNAIKAISDEDGFESENELEDWAPELPEEVALEIFNNQNNIRKVIMELKEDFSNDYYKEGERKAKERY